MENSQTLLEVDSVEDVIPVIPDFIWRDLRRIGNAMKFPGQMKFASPNVEEQEGKYDACLGSGGSMGYKSMISSVSL